jgi:hypothetical protein
MRNGNLISDAKGRFAETIISTILEYAGYRVVRLGVEEAVSEVKAGVARGESPLKLPDQLRTAPDFLVVDPRSGVTTLLEVKFRRTFDDEVARLLHLRLKQQVALWPGTVTAIVCAQVPETAKATRPDIRAHIGCLREDDLERLVDVHATLPRFRRLRTLGAVFDAVADVDLYRESEALVGPIRAWA